MSAELNLNISLSSHLTPLSSKIAVNSAAIEQLPRCEFHKDGDLFVKFVLTSCVGGALACFGAIGNLLIFLTLFCVSNRTANKLYLAQMSICDMIMSISAMLLYGVEHFAEYFDIQSLYSAWVTYLPYVYGIGHCAQTNSVGLLMIGCVERYLDVAFHRSVYGLWFSSVLLVVVPFMLIFVLNVLTIRHMRIAMRRRRFVRKKGMSRKKFSRSVDGRQSWQAAVREYYNRQRWQRRRTRDRQATIDTPINTTAHHLSDPVTREVTTTFAAFVTVFLLSNSWSVVLTMLECSVGAMYLIVSLPTFYSASREAINICAVIGTAVTFGIYCSFSAEFRRDFAEFCRRPTVYRPKKPAVVLKDQHSCANLTEDTRLTVEDHLNKRFTAFYVQL